MLKRNGWGGIPFIATTNAPRTITNADSVSVYITAVRPPEMLKHIRKFSVIQFDSPNLDTISIEILLSMKQAEQQTGSPNDNCNYT